MTPELIPIGGAMQIRASMTPLLYECPGAALLEKVPRHNMAAEQGTAAHKAFEAIIQGKDVDVDTLVGAYNVDREELTYLIRSFRSKWDEVSEYFPDPQTEVEMQLELEGVTITGHSDVISCPGDHTIRIADPKTGRRTSSDYTAQLRTYALMAWRSLDEWFWADDSARDIERVYVTPLWIRESADVLRFTDGMWFPVAELEAWEQTLINIAKRARAGELAINDHCRDCEVVACPLLQKQLAAIRAAGDLPAWTRENVPLYRDFGKWMEEQAALIDKAARQMVNQTGPIDVGDGKALGFRPDETREYKITEESLELLREELSEAEIHSVLKLGLSDTLNMIGDKAPRGSKKKAIEAFCEKARLSGAITLKPNSTFGVHAKEKIS